MESKKKRKSRKGFVLAMKNGIEGWFNEYAWNIGKPEKHGWEKCGTIEDIDKIDVEAVGTVEVIKTEIPNEDTKIVVENVEEEEKDYPTDDEIRVYLNGLADEGKIRRPHVATGQKKLRKYYDENTK